MYPLCAHLVWDHLNFITALLTLPASGGRTCSIWLDCARTAEWKWKADWNINDCVLSLLWVPILILVTGILQYPKISAETLKQNSGKSVEAFFEPPQASAEPPRSLRRLRAGISSTSPRSICLFFVGSPQVSVAFATGFYYTPHSRSTYLTI